jgi:hypothetical protein
MTLALQDIGSIVGLYIFLETFVVSSPIKLKSMCKIKTDWGINISCKYAGSSGKR